MTTTEPAGGSSATTARARIAFETAAQHATRVSGYAVEYVDCCCQNASLMAARYRLGNGLTIVLSPDATSPVFAYQTWFRVGSKHEDPSRTGLAHLFEHLMFKGTECHQAGELDLEMERRGSQTNAATWVDWTYYTQTLAARGDNLPTVAHFEVDRMRGLVLDARTFASELEVVKNERRQSVDNSVGGTMAERLYSLAFGRHPYRWPTIGLMDHLEATTLEDLKTFYDRFYVPANATVVIAGGIDVQAVLVLLARSYGPLPRQSVPEVLNEAEPRQLRERSAVTRKPLLSAQVLLGYHAPSQQHRDFAAIEMLAHILLSGDTGRLYRRLVTREQVATDVTGGLAPFADPGMLELGATVRAGVDPRRVVDLIQQELDALRAGLVDGEAAKACNALELSVLDGLKDAEGCAEALGHYETNFRDYSLAFRAAHAYAAVTAADLKRVARSFLRATNRTVVVAEPETPP